MSDYKYSLLGLMTHTSLHAGNGASDQVVDLPIQREAHTDWPCVYGSGVKGALRAKAEMVWNGNEQQVYSVFGPPPNNNGAHENAGALMVGDARLVLLPVRSLDTHFRWLTCPAMLSRLNRDLNWLNLPVMDLDCLSDLDSNEAFVNTQGSDEIYLEEYKFIQKKQELKSIISTLNQLMDERETELQAQVTIVNNDAFRHMCRAATPIQTHIQIDNATGTAKDGALWTEENLPPDTLLYTSLTSTPARRSDMTAIETLQTALSLFTDSPYLQLGGNETTGMGWCKVTKWSAVDERNS